MAKPFHGGGCNFDLNTIGEVRLLQPFGMKANIIVDQFGGEAGNAHVDALELTLNSLVFNAVGPFDTNVVYLGDGSIQTNTPWKIISNCPTGWRGDMSWETTRIVFKPDPHSDGLLPLHADPKNPDNFHCLYSFVFYLMALELSHPVPYSIPGPPFTQQWPPEIINQTAVSRVTLLNGNHELAGMHATQCHIVQP